MRRRKFFAGALLGSIGLGALGLACGLDFGDVVGTSSPSPAVRPSPTATSSGTLPADRDALPPDPSEASADAGTGTWVTPDSSDASVLLDDADARPTPTAVTPTIAFRFELNGLCFSAPLGTCTFNDGTFGRSGRLNGAELRLGGTPSGGPAGTTPPNALRANIGAVGSTDAIDIEDATDMIPATPATKLTVAAWVKRAQGNRERARIVSLSPIGAGPAIFELGFKQHSDTKLVLSLGDDLGSGKESAQVAIPAENVWTFVAATFDDAAPTDQVCFYRGTEALLPVSLGCSSYSGRTLIRAAARLSVGNAARGSTRAANPKVSFPGEIDNVFVYVGAALTLAELTTLQRD